MIAPASRTARPRLALGRREAPTTAADEARRSERQAASQPEPRESPWAQPLAWLAVALLTVVAVLLPDSAPGLPPFWLPTGAAAVVSMRSRRLLDTLWLTLLIGGLTGLAAALGVPVSVSPPLIALCAGVAVLQARHTGYALRNAWRELLRDTRPPLLRRAAASARIVLFCIAPRALLAGLAMAGLDLLAHQQGWDGWPDAPLPTLGEFRNHLLVYAAASGLSILVLAPLLAWDHGHVPHSRTVAVFAAAGWLLAGLLLYSDHALMVLPVLAMLAGWVGGVWLLALSVSVDAAALLAVMAWREISPFEGPDGFVVFLMVVWRTMLAGLLMTALHERRLQRVLLPKGPAGARVFRNLVALRRAAPVKPKTPPAPGAGTLWLHIDLPLERTLEQTSRLGQLEPTIGESVLPPGVEERSSGWDSSSQLTSVQPEGPARDGRASSLPSPRLPALMKAVAQVLRRSDSVVPIAGESLVVLVTGMEARHVARLVDRIDLAMVREGRRHIGPAHLRQAVLLDVHAIDVLLTTAQYLTIDG